MDRVLRDVELTEALAVYAGSLAIEARVALFGDSSMGIAGRLLEAGARAVHVWDPDRERAMAVAEGAPPGVSVQAYPPAEDGLPSADLVLVTDLGLFEDPGEVVALARDMAGDVGIALIRAANRETAPEAMRAFDYYELFDLVAGPFSTVRMVAELAFDGVALVALGEETDEAPAVSVDTQLADDDRSVAAFVAVASEREIALEPYSIIELPPVEADTSGARMGPAPSAAQALADALERKLEDQTARCADLEAELEARSDRLSSLSAEVDALRAAVDAAAVSASEVEDLARRAEQVDALAERAGQAERRAATLERDLATTEDARATEIDRLEGALRERAQAVRSLENELGRRDEIVKDLVSSLSEAGITAQPAAPAPLGHPPVGAAEPSAPSPAALGELGSPPEANEQPISPSAIDAREGAAGEPWIEENVRLRQQLDTLALDLARREADAHAAAWTVAELERRLAQQAEPRAESSEEAKGALSRALDEVDALRRALAQEHAARVRVESGAALAQARSEIERLTVLLEQQASEQRAASDARTGRSDEPIPPVP